LGEKARLEDSLGGALAEFKMAAEGDGKGGKKPKPKRYKVPKSGSGKEKASDCPSWAQGERPEEGESGKSFAHRMMKKYRSEEYPKGDYPTAPGSDFNKLKKYADRGFEDPPGEDD
jgi:hypothetical protein